MPYSQKARNVVGGESGRAHLLSTPLMGKDTYACKGIGAMICELLASESCNIAVSYLSSEGSAKEVAAKV